MAIDFKSEAASDPEGFAAAMRRVAEAGDRAAVATQRATLHKSASTWNGPVCHTCGRGYIGPHVCRVEDLRKRIADLQALIERIENT